MTKEEKSQYNILILEDMKITQKDIRKKVEVLGYNVCGVATTYEEAIEVAEQFPPDVALCDIKLEGYRDGIQTANKLKEMGDVSIVFLTAHNKNEFVSRAVKINPAGYLLKKILNPDILDIHLQIAIRNLKNKTVNESKIDNGKFFAWDRGIYHVITIAEILYVEANNNSTYIVTEEQIFNVNQKFGDIIHQLSTHNIVQVGRSHAINLNKIKAIDKGIRYVEINLNRLADKLKPQVERTINVSKSHRQQLKQLLGL